MTEFGATLQAFIKLAKFPHQSAYAERADVADSTVTRVTSGGSFSTELLKKLSSPFEPEKQAELARSYCRDRLKEGKIADAVIIAALGSPSDALAPYKPDVRMLAVGIAAAASEDPLFKRTVEDLLELIDEDARRRRFSLMADTSGKPHPSTVAANQLLGGEESRDPRSSSTRARK